MRLGLAFLFITSTASAQLAQVDRAFALTLSPAELERAATGVRETLLRERIRGTIAENASPDGKVRFNRLTYQFRVDALQLVPRGKSIHFDVTLKDVHVAIGRVELGVLNLSCEDLRASSFGHGIPVSADVEPRVTERHDFEVTLSGARVTLGKQNFLFRSIGRCRGLGILNPLIAQAVLFAANTMHDEIRETLRRQVLAQQSAINSAISRFFEVNLSLPFSQASFGRLLGNFRLFPSEVHVSHDRLILVIGASFDAQNPARWRIVGIPREELLRFRPRMSSSFIAISAELFNLAFRQAGERGMFQGKITAADDPSLEKLLRTSAIASLIPDIIDRFPEDRPVEIELRGVRDVAFGLEETAGAGTATLVGRFDGLALRIWIEGKPYYDFSLRGVIPLQLRLDPYRGDLRVEVGRVRSMDLVSAAFAPGLAPPPDPAGGMTEESLDAFVEALASVMESEPGAGTLARISLPPFRLGSMRLRYLGVEVPNSFLALPLTLSRF